jgi:hypothetical protein
VFDQTYNFLNNNDLLSKEQSGFRHLHSTLTAMLDAIDQWYTNMDNGLINAILFVDLKKAFDTIDHEILLGKLLNRYGFSNQTVELFRNYLSGRTQITVINNVSSGSCKITCGRSTGILFWARYCSYSISMTSLNVSWYQMGVYSPMIPI